jgi:hypothetical protein
MKYSLNKKKLDYLHYKCGVLAVNELNSYLGVQGWNFTNDIHCGQHWNIDQIFCTYLDYLG